MTEDFSPIETIEQALRRWWLVALFVICGGGVGLLAHVVLPPLYEAKVVFSAVVDFKQSGAIDTLEQDKSINLIGDIIISKTMVDLVAADAHAAGIQVDGAAFLRMAYLERKSEITELRIRNASPTVAQTLANLWADQAYSVLKTYLQHAQQADALEQQLAVLSVCVQQAYLPGNPDSPCNITNAADISAQYQKVSNALHSERLASGGLPGWVIFDLQQKADLPSQPVTDGTNTFILAGGFIGFVLAVWAVAGKLPDRFSWISRQKAQSFEANQPHSQPGEAKGRHL